MSFPDTWFQTVHYFQSNVGQRIAFAGMTQWWSVIGPLDNFHAGILGDATCKWFYDIHSPSIVWYDHLAFSTCNVHYSVAGVIGIATGVYRETWSQGEMLPQSQNVIVQCYVDPFSKVGRGQKWICQIPTAVVQDGVVDEDWRKDLEDRWNSNLTDISFDGVTISPCVPSYRDSVLRRMDHFRVMPRIYMRRRRVHGILSDVPLGVPRRVPT